MIPISLTIKGLYSYQEKQSIDFSKLTQASIFGIFGNVGCGKSSILEAITFALYGKTDRLNLSGDNRNYNMMNLKSNELLIDFEFLAGNPQIKYRTVVIGKRNSKRFEDVKTLDRKGYIWQNENWQPIELESIEKTLELSYENFKRTIIIPQGKFQEFLQLGNKDRTQMMKELFDLEKYELFYKVVSLESKNNSNIDILNGKLQGLGEISLEEIKLLKQSFDELKKVVETLSEEQAKFNKQQKEFEILKKLFEKKQILLSRQKEIQKKEATFIELEKKLKEFEYCKLNFEPLLKDQSIYNTEAKELEQLIKNNEILLKQNVDKLSNTEQKIIALKPKTETLDTQKKELAEFDYLLKIFDLRTEISAFTQRIEKGNAVVLETEKNVILLKNKIKSTEKELNQLKEKKPDLIKLASIKEWFTKSKTFEKSFKEEISQINDCDTKMKGIRTEINVLTSDLSFINEINDENLPSVPDLLTEEIEKLKNNFSTIDKEREGHLINSKLGEYAESLHNGQACPLCGSEDHPHIYNAQDAAQQLKMLDTKKENIANNIKILEEKNKHISDLLNTYKYINELKKTAEQKHKNLNAEFIIHNKINTWPEFTNIEAVLSELTKAKNIEAEIVKNEKQLTLTRTNTEKEQKNFEDYKSGIDLFKNQKTGKEHSLETLQQQIIHLNENDFTNKQKQEIEHLKLEKQKTIQNIEKETEELSTLNNKLKLDKERLSEAIRSKKQQLEAINQKLTKVKTELTENLQKSVYETIENVSEILSLPINIEHDRNKIESFKQEKSTINKQLEENLGEINQRTYKADEHIELNAKIENHSLIFRSKDQELAVLNKDISQKEKTLQSKKEILKEKDQLENRAVNLKTLKQLFKASGFVNYISTVHLQNICQAANERFFKLTGQKLSLEISDDNNFLVRDFMNGGKTRNVKTLSGGQTFQAALSLALALADSIQNKSHSKENFFFLDEGFGSLDKEALNVVFDTLKSLRKENRIVGVISHVEEMQDEVDAHLKIEFDDERGSLIHSSI
ncbi:MAG: AAA family ATPase [Salinivirgaceae bacterium]|nr:AAA family ATPase [Salinivirgaceae bacterium]